MRFAREHCLNGHCVGLALALAPEKQRFRITTVGAYTYKKLIGTFVYLDAVVADTPVVDDDVAAGLEDAEEMAVLRRCSEELARRRGRFARATVQDRQAA